MATLVKIPKDEKDAVARTLADCNVTHAFYTIEANENLLVCEINEDSPSIMWTLGKMVGIRSTNDGWFTSMTNKKPPKTVR